MRPSEEGVLDSLMTLQDFIGRHPPLLARRPPSNNDELRQFGPADGVLILDGVPARGKQGPADDARTRHLWVFRAPEPTDIPYVLEGAPAASPRPVSGVAKHTNLTGGGTASCRGELWIDVSDARRLYVNGSSGRYGPRSPQQLDDAIEVFRGLGFDVESYGWDEDTNKPYSLYYR